MCNDVATVLAGFQVTAEFDMALEIERGSCGTWTDKVYLYLLIT